jgi:hypothetical protein
MPVDLDALWRVIEAQPATPGTVKTHGTGRNAGGGEILVAIDEDGARALLFPVAEDDNFAPDTSTKVNLRRRTLRWSGGEGEFIAVTCRVDHLKPVFTTLAGDMLEAGSRSPQPGVVLRQVLEEWRDLLSAERRSILPRHSIVGLVAELMTLREVLRGDSHRDVSAWTGPDESLHDFRKGSHALEVKGSLIREGLYAEIHGLRQLEPPAGGDLHLLFFRFEEAPDGELSLPDLVRDIVELGVDRREFVDRLARAGYHLSDEEAYSTIRLHCVERRVYGIDESFPRVIPRSFVVGDAPPGVILVRYTVDLTGASPAPLPPPAADRILAAFGEAG